MTFEQTYRIDKNNKLTITLPEQFRNKTKVRIIIEECDDSRQSKIDKLKLAANDPLFLADVKEVASDFQDADHELL